MRARLLHQAGLRGAWALRQQGNKLSSACNTCPEEATSVTGFSALCFSAAGDSLKP